jgi:glycosyltransferase involved in cell wall biosynthesis
MTGPADRMTAPIKLTIGVLTLNEEKRIANCIRSAQFAGHIILVDSGSKDRTREIATELGAEVYGYPDWQGFAVQRNRLLQHVKAAYILFLDADEGIPPKSQKKILEVVERGHDEIREVQWTQVAFSWPLIPIKSTGGPQRLVKRRSIRQLTGIVHEQANMREGDRAVRSFHTQLLHYSHESVHESLQKPAQYAPFSAAKRAQAGKKGGVLRGMASALSTFIPLYIFRRGFLCGPEGFLFYFFVALESYFAMQPSGMTKTNCPQLQYAAGPHLRY